METNYDKIKKGERWLYSLNHDENLQDLKVLEKLNSAIQIEESSRSLFGSTYGPPPVTRSWITIAQLNNEYTLIEKISSTNE